MNKTPHTDNGSEKYALLFRNRNAQNPQGFSDALDAIIEDLLNGKITVGQTKMVIALEEDYGQLDQGKRLPWRIPLLDRKTAVREA
jgi:hypothetical protein